MTRQHLQRFLFLTALLAVTIFSFIRARKPATVFISAAQMNDVLYSDIDNIVKVHVNGIKPGDVQVTATNATITASGENYIVHPTETHKTTIYVTTTKKGKQDTLAVSAMRVKKIPSPVCYVGNIRDIGIIEKENLLLERGVFARMTDFDFNMRATIVSFDMTVHRDSAYVTATANGPAFTPAMQNMMKQARFGDRIFIENVIVGMPGNATRKIPGVTLVVR